jgi:hypothetical protein
MMQNLISSRGLPKQVERFVANIAVWQVTYVAAVTLEDKLAAAHGMKLWLQGVYREIDLHALDQVIHLRSRHAQMLASMGKQLEALDCLIHSIRDENREPLELVDLDPGKILNELRSVWAES